VERRADLIVESTVDSMKSSAPNGRLVAAIGPLIRQHSYEVGGIPSSVS